jgi:hypothetical protein
MRNYITLIAKNRSLDLETARLAYALMVVEYGTLDGLGPASFDLAADLAAAEAAMDRDTASKVADSYGIPSIASLGLED